MMNRDYVGVFARNMTKRFVRVSLLFMLALAPASGTFAQQAASDATEPRPQLQTALQQASAARPVELKTEDRSILQQFGTFSQDAKYGEVWKPSTTPENWHPYMACNWVNTKQFGWYYDDKSPWGNIVHHYGRWMHDPQSGWIWIPGMEFSPGWVVWRTSPQWVGWAPIPPDQDLQTMNADAFNNGGFWTFMETPNFNSGCKGADAPQSQIPTLLKTTQFVTNFRFRGGIGVFVLPTYVFGPIIDLPIVVQPWPELFYQQFILIWTFIWTQFDVVTIEITVPCRQPPPRDQCPPGQYPNTQGRCTPPTTAPPPSRTPPTTAPSPTPPQTQRTPTPPTPVIPPPSTRPPPPHYPPPENPCPTGARLANGQCAPTPPGGGLPPQPCQPPMIERGGTCFLPPPPAPSPSDKLCPDGRYVPAGATCAIVGQPPSGEPGGHDGRTRCPDGRYVPAGATCAHSGQPGGGHVTPPIAAPRWPSARPKPVLPGRQNWRPRRPAPDVAGDEGGNARPRTKTCANGAVVSVYVRCPVSRAPDSPSSRGRTVYPARPRITPPGPRESFEPRRPLRWPERQFTPSAPRVTEPNLRPSRPDARPSYPGMRPFYPGNQPAKQGASSYTGGGPRPMLQFRARGGGPD
jgi:hypothetical protein